MSHTGSLHPRCHTVRDVDAVVVEHTRVLTPYKNGKTRRRGLDGSRDMGTDDTGTDGQGDGHGTPWDARGLTSDEDGASLLTRVHTLPPLL